MKREAEMDTNESVLSENSSTNAAIPSSKKVKKKSEKKRDEYSESDIQTLIEINRHYEAELAEALSMQKSLSLQLNELNIKYLELYNKQSKNATENTGTDEQYLEVEMSDANNKENSYANVQADIDYPKLPDPSNEKSTSTQAGNSKTKQSPTTIKSNRQSQPMTRVDSKMPPFIVYNMDTKAIINTISTDLKHKNFFINRLNQNATQVIVKNIKDYIAVKEMLNNKLVKYFTYTPRCEKPTSILLKKLASTYSAEDVESAIKEIPDLECNILKTSKFGNHWLIQFNKNTNIKDILNIKYLLNQRVEFVKFIPSKISQCKRCQRIGHIATNCSMPYRCVKCGEGHGPKNCTLPAKEENNIITFQKSLDGSVVETRGVPPKCVLCNEVGHTANYRKCPKFIEINKKKQLASNQLKTRVQTNQTYLNNIVTHGRSYAGVTRTAPTKNTPISKLNSFDIINNDCKTFFKMPVSECVYKINTFLPKYQEADDINIKKSMLFELFLNICANGQ